MGAAGGVASSRFLLCGLTTVWLLIKPRSDVCQECPDGTTVLSVATRNPSRAGAGSNPSSGGVSCQSARLWPLGSSPRESSGTW